jgi:hypothetical protein
MTKRYMVVYPVFISSEVYYFDTLAEVKQHIEDFTIEDSDEEKAVVRVFEIQTEIDVKSLLERKNGLNVMVPGGVKFKNCLCCGQSTLTSEIHDICSNCEWQDDPNTWNDIDDDNNANGVSLRQARINYERYGECDGIDHAKRGLKNRKPGEILTADEVEQKYGYTKEHYAWDLLHFDNTLTREEKIELLSKLSLVTIESIPVEDIGKFGFETEEWKRLLVAFKLVYENKDFFDLEEDEGVSEEIKLRVEELKKQLEPEEKENNDLYQLIDGIVNEEYRFDKKLQQAYLRAKEDNFAKGIPWIYRDDEGDIVYEFPDGRVVKKKDLDEDG